MSGDDVIEKFMKVKKLVRSIIRLNLEELYGLTLTEVHVLLKVPTEQEMKPSRLSELTNFSNTLITFSLDSLEQKGLIERNKGQDRRTVIVSLTPDGAEKRERLQQAMNRNIDEKFSRLTQEEMTKLRRALDETISYLGKIDQ